MTHRPGQRWSAPWVRHLVCAVVFVTAVGLTVGWLGPGGGLAGTATAAGTGTAAQTADLATRADAGSSGCDDPVRRQTWRVRWQVRQGAVSATGLDRRRWAAGGWSDVSGDTWALRWDLTPAQLTVSGTSRINELRGPLERLGRVRIAVAQSPRFVSPDGACTVYVAAFGNGSADWPEVAVIGDSLVAQLRDARNSAAFRQGLVQAELSTGRRPRRVEVVGQGGRRWTAVPDGTTGQDQADHVMLDEIRGLRGVRAQVLALGTNDAGWVALAPDAAEAQSRLDWVLTELDPVLDEVAGADQCTVLVTAADAPARYLGSQPSAFARAAGQINARLRDRAERSGSDRLRLWDWARQSAGHHAGSAEPWFGPDTIHLNQVGRVAYASALVQAADTC